jgi:hypothetical protein
MKTSSNLSSEPARNMSGPMKVIRSIGLALLILMFTFGLADSLAATVANGPLSDEATSQSIDETVPRAMDHDADVKTLTMAIDLEEGGAVDLEALPGDVTIGRWNGEEILVIVEKIRHARRTEGKAAADPINIKVSRHGKNVRIETLGDLDWSLSGMGVSFRILLPERRSEVSSTTPSTYILSKLTSALWRRVPKDALKWLAR